MFVGVNTKFECFEGLGTIQGRCNDLFKGNIGRNSQEEFVEALCAWILIYDSMDGIEEKLTKVISHFKIFLSKVILFVGYVKCPDR